MNGDDWWDAVAGGEAAGTEAVVDFDPSTTFDTPSLGTLDDPWFVPTDPDVPLGEPPAGSFRSTSDVLRDEAAGIPRELAPAAGTTSTFDWSQIGELFTRVGQAIGPIVQTGRDIAAVVTGRPTSAQIRQQQAEAAMRQAQQQRLLLLVGLGVGGLLLLRRGR